MPGRAGSLRERIRPLLWALVVGVTVAVIQAAAGVRNPLGLLLPALGVFVVVALVLEFWPWLRPRLARLLRVAMARSPIIVEIRVRRRPKDTFPEGERGIWDFRRDGDRAMAAMSSLMQEMTVGTMKSSKEVARHARRMGKLVAGPFTSEQMHKRGQKAGRDIERHAVAMEGLETRYREQRESMIQNYADWFHSQPGEGPVAAWRAELQTLAGVIAESVVANTAYLDSVKALRGQNFNQPMNRATNRLVAVLTRMVENLTATEQFCRNPGGGLRDFPQVYSS